MSKEVWCSSLQPFPAVICCRSLHNILEVLCWCSSSYCSAYPACFASMSVQQRAEAVSSVLLGTTPYWSLIQRNHWGTVFRKGEKNLCENECENIFIPSVVGNMNLLIWGRLCWISHPESTLPLPNSLHVVLSTTLRWVSLRINICINKTNQQTQSHLKTGARFYLTTIKPFL